MRCSCKTLGCLVEGKHEKEDCLPLPIELAVLLTPEHKVRIRETRKRILEEGVDPDEPCVPKPAEPAVRLTWPERYWGDTPSFRDQVTQEMVRQGIDPGKPKKEMVVGFRFSPNINAKDDRMGLLLLLRKNRPPWQAGKLNGVGGKIEPNEDPLMAMRREYEEEVGVAIEDWERRIVLIGDDFVLHVFWSVGPIELPRKRNDVGEKLEIVPFRNVPDGTIPNLRWMIPLCADRQIQGPIFLREVPKEVAFFGGSDSQVAFSGSRVPKL